MKVPSFFSSDLAANLQVNICTAYRLLKDFVQLKPGDYVAQNAANSIVGQSVIQLARAMQLKTVNVVRARPNLSDLVQELKTIGADQVYTEEDLRSAEVRKAIQSFAPRLAFNAVGGASTTELIKNLPYVVMSCRPHAVVLTGVL